MTHTFSATEVGCWSTLQYSAPPHLRPFVHGYVASSSVLPNTVRERHLPSLEVALFVNFGAPHRRLDSLDARTGTALDGTWVTGLYRQPQLTEAVGERHFMIVRFTPIGAHLMLGLPMSLLANDTVDLREIDAALARTLVSRIGAAGDWRDRFAAMDALLAERLSDVRVPAGVMQAWRALSAADGRVALGALASSIGCSHRTLIARFEACVGFPPKTIARLLRFNRAVKALDRRIVTRGGPWAGEPYIEQCSAHPVRAVRWADLASDCGYVDQAHFIKEFKEFAGVTPQVFIRRVSSAV